MPYTKENSRQVSGFSLLPHRVNLATVLLSESGELSIDPHVYMAADRPNRNLIYMSIYLRTCIKDYRRFHNSKALVHCMIAKTSFKNNL